VRKISAGRTHIRPEVGIDVKTKWDPPSFQVPQFYAPNLKLALIRLILCGGIAYALRSLYQFINK